MLVDRRGHAAPARRVGPVAGLEVPHRVGLGDLAAALDQLVGGGTQSFDPVLGNRSFEKKIPLGEVMLALLLRQHARLEGKNLLGCHRTASFSVSLTRARTSAPLRSRGSHPASMHMAAAWPMAWPYEKHCAVTRAEATASCCAERQRPAKSRPSPRCGTKQP